jgi:hypothetical protein
VLKLQGMEFYSLNAVKLILYCTKDPCHKLLLVVEEIPESIDNYANDIIALMIYPSENLMIELFNL